MNSNDNSRLKIHVGVCPRRRKLTFKNYKFHKQFEYRFLKLFPQAFLIVFLRLQFCMNKLRQLQWPRYTWTESSHFYIIAFKRLQLQARPDVFQKCFLFQKLVVTLYVFAGYVWTQDVKTAKCLRIQTNADTCRRGLRIFHAFVCF